MNFKLTNSIKQALLFVGVLFICLDSNAQDYPLSDPDNSGDWVLNGDFSDEFEGASLNSSRWHRQGEFTEGCEGDGCRDGIYYNGFEGRWPAQFRPENALIADGQLILSTKWEPDFVFIDECDPNAPQYCYGKDGETLVPVTTAGVNTLKQFTYGYMEILSKAADAEITSAFWTIGSGAEIDMFEMFGKYEPESRKHKEKELKFNLIEWSNNFKPRFDTFIPTDWRVADEFHTYGFEWDDTSVSIYIDGVFINKFTGADFTKNMQEGTDWTFTGSQRLWVDSEVFNWNGIPNEEDLPAEYQIEYIRVWQKSDQIEDVTAPILSNLDAAKALDQGEVSIDVSEQARLFVVPEGTVATLTAIEAADQNLTVSNEGTSTITFMKDAGTYIVYAADWAGNVSASSESFIVQSTPALGTDEGSKFTIAPNPVANLLTLRGSEVLSKDTLVIFNTMGQEFKLPVVNNSIDVSSLSKGMYLLRFTDNSTLKFYKK